MCVGFVADKEEKRDGWGDREDSGVHRSTPGACQARGCFFVFVRSAPDSERQIARVFKGIRRVVCPVDSPNLTGRML